MRPAVIVIGATLWTALGAPADYASARRKLDMIEQNRARPGSTIVFTAAEIVAWAEVEVPKVIPEGFRRPRVELGNGSANGSALLDFIKMRHAQGAKPNWFFDKLLAGERPVKVQIEMRSGGGKATVFLRRVEISGVAATGVVLDFLVKNYFMTLYPNAKVNEPFDLDYGMERIDVRPNGVHVKIKNR